jgi:hypothetical protein
MKLSRFQKQGQHMCLCSHSIRHSFIEMVREGMSAISINRLPQSYPFMETVRTETLQAQGWEKWLPGSKLLSGTDSLKSTP